MKKIIMMLFISMLIFGCSSQDLPPEPGAFTGSGQATGALPDWAADPGSKFSMGQARVMMQGGVGKVKAKVTGDQYVYNQGYVYMNGNWEPFSFSEEALEGSNWIGGTANADIDVTQDQMPEGKYYMVAYSCSKVADLWECNGNKWMLQSFDVSGGLPDLALGITSWKEFSKLNEPVEVVFTISNNGQSKVESFDVNIQSVCSVSQENFLGLNLDVGESLDYNFMVNCPAVGEYSFNIRIDPQQQIDELDENNNIADNAMSIYECLSGETKCVSDRSYTSCTAENKWSSLPPSPCNPGLVCQEGKCVVVTIPPTEDITTTLTLQPGWNTFSLPLVPVDDYIVEVLKSIEGKYATVRGFYPDGAKVFDPEWSSASFSDLQTLDVEHGYQIKITDTEPVTLSYVGTPIPAPSVDFEYQLFEGWNVISMPYAEPKNIADLSFSRGYSVIYYVEGAVNHGAEYCDDPKVFCYYPDGLQEFTQFEPGKGYTIDTI